MRIKNFTLLTLALLLMSVVAFAQKPSATQRVLTPKQQALQAMRTGRLTQENASAFKFAKPALPQNMQKAKANKPVLPVALQAPAKTSPKFAAQQAYAKSKSNRTNRTSGLVTLPDGASVTPYYTTGGKFYVNSSSGWLDYTSKIPTVNIAFVGNDVYIQNLAYWFNTAWVKGSLSDNTITFPSGQFVGEDEYGAEYLIAIDSQTSEFKDAFTFTYDADAGTLTCADLIAESASATEVQVYCYWDAPVFSLGAPEKPETVTPPAGLTTETWTVGRYFYNGEDEIPEEKVLKVGFDGNDVYVYGFSYNTVTEGGWIKGTLSADGKSISFASDQYYGYDDDLNDYYFVGYDWEAGSLVSAVVVAYDAEAGTMTWPENIYIYECASLNYDWYGFFYWIPAMVKGTAPDPLAAPDIVTTEWLFKSQSISEDQETGEYVLSDYNLHVNVGIAGTDVFVQGISEDLPDAWIKGTLDPKTNKVTFPTGQYLGQAGFLFWVFDYYFAGYGENGLEDVVMAYDPEAKTLTMESPTDLLINAAWLLYDPNLILTDVTLQEIADVAATPAQPTITAATLDGNYPNVTINVPDTDAEGNPLLVGKLSYQYYYDVNHTVSPLTLSPSEYMYLYADMTEIPYTFTDDYDIYNYRLYLNMDISTWNKIGIQSIYRGGGEEHKSEIFWYTFVPYPHQVTFVAANDLSIQNGKATVTVNGKKAAVDAEGKLEVPETYTVTITAAKGYRFVSASSTGTTVTLSEDLFSATFEMPTEDVTINYELRAMDGEIIFATEGQYTIQGGQANVLVGDADVTKAVDANGKLIDIAQGLTVTINAAQGYKLASVTASYDAVGASDPIINYVLTDSYGDGWNGAALQIVNATTSEVVNELTLSGASAEGTIELVPEQTYNFVWVPGSYDSECGFVITDANEKEIVSYATATGLSGVIASYTVPAASSIPPVGVDVALAKKGNTASFIMPGPGGRVNVAYELVRLGSPINIPAGAYITYYTDKDILIYDTDCELMTVTGLNGNEVTVTPLNVVAANTPMLIYNSGAEKELWIVPAEETADAPAADEVTVLPAFKGTLTGQTFTEADMAANEYYACNGTSFAWVRGAGTIGANKCWLEFVKDAAPKAPSLAIVYGDGGTTGINTVNAKMETEGQYYDLNGRKLNAAPTQKGVYIINGKKAVIK
jgi:hypothetical protein